MNTATKLYITQNTILILSILCATQIILTIQQITPYNTYNIASQLTLTIIFLTLLSFLFEIEKEYYQLLDELHKHMKRENK